MCGLGCAHDRSDQTASDTRYGFTTRQRRQLIPQSYLKIVQPSEQGVIRDILVEEGERAKAGQIMMLMDTGEISMKRPGKLGLDLKREV
jgi:multidrug efflux pump subunit AcrA (membrane-fusion protein)